MPTRCKNGTIVTVIVANDEDDEENIFFVNLNNKLECAVDQELAYAAA